MLKSEDAVIPMQKNFHDVDFIFPDQFDSAEFARHRPLMPFDAECVDYLNGLSSLLNKNQRIAYFPDVATFAFFCRKANILNLRKKFYTGENIKLGRGILFHVAPSNVPVNFAYSLICGLLSGNANIVRIPSTRFEQVDIICKAIQEMGSQEIHKHISSRIALVKYDRNSTATGLFSSMCDVRIIWGGDDTISQIRKHPLPPRSFDITFADRYSLCVINADKYIVGNNYDATAQAFYNDTYLFDQNACTAPHLVLWLGEEENIRKSKEIFWGKLHKIVKTKYSVQSVIAVDKLTSIYRQAAFIDNIKKESSADNLLWRISLPELTADIENYRCTSGYFSEYNANRLEDISFIVGRKYQTLSYYGFNKAELTDLITFIRPNGIDRIVPIGRTTEFSLIWDGYNLIEALSRNVDILI